jgi:hypothetical protein
MMKLNDFIEQLKKIENDGTMEIVFDGLDSTWGRTFYLESSIKIEELRYYEKIDCVSEMKSYVTEFGKKIPSVTKKIVVVSLK